jgi:murein DD-endopeptidase MepM/ murein hydrolase activator NlpD
MKSKWWSVVLALFALAFLFASPSNWVETRSGTQAGQSKTDASPSKPPEHTPKPVLIPLDVVVPIAPAAFQADGKWHLVYEFHVTNVQKWDCTLTGIEVLTPDPARKSLASFIGSDLERMMAHPGQEVAEKSKISPGTFTVVYMWVTLDKLEDVPASIQHRIAMKIGDYPEEISFVGVPVPVGKKPVVVIAPPLMGENWLAGNGPSNTSQHRRAFIPVDGRAYISRRFAIDWVQLYPNGKTYQGDPSDNKNYRAYGAEIHAVADGIVTDIKDGIPQNTPGAKSLAVTITRETVGGNHVIVDIGNGLFAFYAHMQPGSLRVKLGDKVRRGQVLGLLGNTGNSSEPHLHFQICNANSELGSEGLPYAFPSYEVQGKGWTWKSSESHNNPVKHEMEIPLEDEVVRFPAAP